MVFIRSYKMSIVYPRDNFPLQLLASHSGSERQMYVQLFFNIVYGIYLIN